MIAVYPMLVSPNVNPGVLPGICKALERFVIIYKMDDLAKKFNIRGKVVVGTQAAIQAASMFGKRKNESYVKEDGTKQGWSAEEEDRKRQQHDWARSKHERDTEKGKNDLVKTAYDLAGSRETMSIEYPKSEAISVEPTYVTVNTSTGTKIIGVKVIPFTVKSSEELGIMLMNDMSLKKLDAFMYANTRKIFKLL